MAFTEEDIISALRTVNDPDLKKDLVSLNMIKDVRVATDSVKFTVELTTPACPLKEEIRQDCENAILKAVGQVNVSIDFTSRVTTLRDKSEILPEVKNMIVVASGKGGVGKSTVSVNLAMALSNAGAKVGLIDADIHGPSIPTMLGLKGSKPGIQEVDGKHKILPVELGNLKVLSIGFLVDPNQAIVWRGPMVSSALRQFVNDVIWGELDYLIMDLPPGTGDVHLTIAQSMPITGAVVVTTPQEVALADSRKALSMFALDNINVPIVGVVENMSFFVPPDMPDKKYYLFGEGGGKSLSKEFDVPFIGEIPLKMKIQQGADIGQLAANIEDEKAIFDEIAQNVAQQIAILNSKKKETNEMPV